MSQLSRIKDLVGSFVSTDFKRKRLESETEDNEESPVKKSKNVENEDSLSAPAFLKRVASFKDFAWCRDIPALSPLEISRHGWYSTKDDFMVCCTSCKEYLSLAIPAQDTGIRKLCITTAVDRLSSAHGEFCAWASAPSPLYWTRVEVPDMSSVAVSACKISSLGEKLPHIKVEHMKPWQKMLKSIDQDLLKGEEDNPHVLDTSCVLALCGWQSGLLEDTLEDKFHIRRIGIWNFVSIQDHEDLLEARKVARELGQTVDDERDLAPEGKEYFDPLQEHLSWNPLLQEVDGLPGWQYIIQQNMTKKSLESKAEKKDPLNMLRRVRDLLDYW